MWHKHMGASMIQDVLGRLESAGGDRDKMRSIIDDINSSQKRYYDISRDHRRNMYDRLSPNPLVR